MQRSSHSPGPPHGGRRWRLASVATVALAGWTSAVALTVTDVRAQQGQLCQESSFATAVDEAGERLRSYNLSVIGDLSDRIAALKAAKGWTDQSHDEAAYEYLQDSRIAELDARANDLLSKIDQLGRSAEAGPADCAKLAELKATSDELLAVMKAKTTYTLAKIDGEIADKARAGSEAPKTSAAPAPPAVAPVPPLRSSRLEDAPKPPAAASRPSAPAGTQPSRQTPGAPQSGWESTTAAPGRPAGSPPASGSEVAAAPLPPPGPPPGPTAEPALMPMPPLPPGALESPEAGYTVEEIRDATTGFFGPLSTSVAAVVEQTFRSWGQPTAYVLGSEGGGAFLAGVRYGKGTLFMRRGGSQPIYWHGPSLGTDFGAEGSRTMFLIYRLNEPEQLFRAFTGLGGSAYVLGGVGVTLLKGGPVIMAPIRTGLGLRIGANIGYIRFTPTATWNPF
ncbi:MAG: DUF1134 domain-containing protein [Hyphomicrobiaceae bacterium]|nr:DUF1134 domain-containing protein [Hyphomicrobiaceae bacterium]